MFAKHSAIGTKELLTAKQCQATSCMERGNQLAQSSNLILFGDITS